MVLPLVPIAVAALAGGASAGIAGSLFGSKKGDQITYAPQTADVYHSPYETYQPTTLYAPQQTITMPSYQVSMGSASSPQTMSTRTDATQQVRQQPEYYQPVTYPRQESSAGTASEGDGKTMMIIALIAAGGLVAYGVLS
jgi:hypothetical protein